MKMQVATTVQTMVFCMLGGALSAQQTEPLIETFDGGWRAGSRSVDCEYREQSHLLDMTNGEARLKVDDEYQPPLHIRYSPGSILYIYGDEENGISGAAFDFVNNEMVARDFIPGQTKGNPYSDRIRCAVLE
jgi:hypothetical protein